MNKRTRKQKSEIRKLVSMPDEEIDTSDIPETPNDGRLYIRHSGGRAQRGNPESRLIKRFFTWIPDTLMYSRSGMTK